jgi:hypothetical protein
VVWFAKGTLPSGESGPGEGTTGKE